MACLAWMRQTTLVRARPAPRRTQLTAASLQSRWCTTTSHQPRMRARCGTSAQWRRGGSGCGCWVMPACGWATTRCTTRVSLPTARLPRYDPCRCRACPSLCRPHHRRRAPCSCFRRNPARAGTATRGAGCSTRRPTWTSPATRCGTSRPAVRRCASGANAPALPQHTAVAGPVAAGAGLRYCDRHLAAVLAVAAQAQTRTGDSTTVQCTARPGAVHAKPPARTPTPLRLVIAFRRRACAA